MLVGMRKLWDLGWILWGSHPHASPNLTNIPKMRKMEWTLDYSFCWRRKMLRSCQKEPWQSFPFLHICICQGSNGDDNLAHVNVNTCFTFKRPLDSHSHPSICVCQGSIVSWPPIWRPTTQRALCACRQLANTFLAFHFTLTLRTSSSKYACFCHCCKCFKLYFSL